MFILYLTGAVFIVTELVLVYYMWKYDASSNDKPVKYSHGSHALELVWTILPSVTLLFIAIYQMEAWASAKMLPPHMPPTAEVTGRQFNWDFRYPGPDNELYTEDDIVPTCCTAFSCRTCASSKTWFPAWSKACGSRPRKRAATTSSAPSCAVGATTK